MTKLLQELHALFDCNVIQLVVMHEKHMLTIGGHHFTVVQLTLPRVPVDLHQHIFLWQHWDYRMEELEHW